MTAHMYDYFDMERILFSNCILYCNLDDYQQLAPGEEKDLDVTMSRYECAISNIEAFTEKLSRDLSLLDGVSILPHLVFFEKSPD